MASERERTGDETDEHPPGDRVPDTGGERDELVDESIDESFPASDPPSYWGRETPGDAPEDGG